ncbi:MAG: hypothetical protein M1327_06110 [Candidatus Thermoplasmatota archaeon]|nr:hypothetical protein [Candidatus Thermoplasmatota archaeon]
MLDPYEDLPYMDDAYSVEAVQNDESPNKTLKRYFLKRWSNPPYRELHVENSTDERLHNLEEKMREVEKKLDTIFRAGVAVEPMVVPDFTEKEIAGCMDKIESYLENNDSINPWKYAEVNELDVRLVLLCVDTLISKGKLEW